VIEQRVELVARELEIETLKVQLARLRRMTFGRSSEQLLDRIDFLNDWAAHDRAPQIQILPLPAQVPPCHRVGIQRYGPRDHSQQRLR
jgi:hypothetical protein